MRSANCGDHSLQADSLARIVSMCNNCEYRSVLGLVLYVCKFSDTVTQKFFPISAAEIHTVGLFYCFRAAQHGRRLHGTSNRHVTAVTQSSVKSVPLDLTRFVEYIYTFGSCYATMLRTLQCCFTYTRGVTSDSGTQARLVTQRTVHATTCIFSWVCARFACPLCCFPVYSLHTPFMSSIRWIWSIHPSESPWPPQ